MEIKQDWTKESLPKAVDQMAKEEGKTPLEVITLLQAGAAKTNNTDLLEALCELKWNYIEA